MRVCLCDVIVVCIAFVRALGCKIFQSAYLELRRISSIRHVLTVDATKTLVTSLYLSRLDYCNSLLLGIPQQLIDKLQKV